MADEQRTTLSETRHLRPQRTKRDRINRLRQRIDNIPDGSHTDESIIDVLKAIVDLLEDEQP